VTCICTCVGSSHALNTSIQKYFIELYAVHALFSNDEEIHPRAAEVDDKCVI
jgi:hypothetical protein